MSKEKLVLKHYNSTEESWKYLIFESIPGIIERFIPIETTVCIGKIHTTFT